MPRTATQSMPRTKQAAAQTKRAAKESVDDIKADMATLRERLEALAAAGATEGMHNAQQVFARLQTRFDDFLKTDFAEELGVNAALEKGREASEQASEKIKENPLQSVLIAAGVGAIVGFLMRK